MHCKSWPFHQRFGKRRGFFEPDELKACFQQAVHISFHGAVVFDDSVNEPLGSPFAFVVIPVNRPVQSDSLGITMPLLFGKRGHERMLH